MNGMIIALLLVAVVGLLYVNIVGWGVKYSFTGTRMIKYAVAAYLFKIVLFLGWCYTAQPYVQSIANHIDSSTIDYLYLLGQLGMIALWLVGATGIEMVFAFLILIPLAKKLEF